MAPAQAPTWTLRLKYHKTTVIIDAKPVETLNKVVSELLRALQETHKDGLLQTAVGNVQIPDTTNAIQIAKPNDVQDFKKGCRIIYSGEADSNMDVAGEESKNGTKRKRTDGTQSVKEAGLKDGVVLCFRFSDQLAQDDDEGLGLQESEDVWDVIMPKYVD